MKTNVIILSFIITLLAMFLFSCNQGKKKYNHFAGEQYAICIISYYSDSLLANEIIDSLISLTPSLNERTQEKYNYNVEGTGYDEDVVFFWKDGVHYVLSISYSTINDKQSLKITNFGIDGEVLAKFDGLTDDQLKLAAYLVRERLLIELRQEFPYFNFTCDCGDLDS